MSSNITVRSQWADFDWQLLHPTPLMPQQHMALDQPLNDITSDGGKIGGAAQARRGGAVLHHVTMAYDIDAAKMLQVLRIGREKLSDKGTTSAAKRVDPLRSQTGLAREVVIARMVDAFRQRSGGLHQDELTADELKKAEQLIQEKFGTADWVAKVP